MASDRPEPETRASLLVRLRAAPDDELAWGQFVSRYGPMLRAWCRHWGLQEADADDVGQAVLLKLAVHLRGFTYDPARKFRGFLRTVARNAHVDLLADRRRAGAGSGDSGALTALRAEPAREDLAARIEAAFDQELLALAGAAVRARVEPHTWEAFRLTAVDGLSGAEAAARLGMQVGTVFKARSKVQKMLRDEIDRLEREAEGGP